VNSIVRIAAAQYPIERFDTLADYEAKLARWVTEAAGAGAELVVFPEYGAMELAGARHDDGGAAAETLAGSLEAAAHGMEQLAAAHARLAALHKVHILAASGPYRTTAGRFVNRARLFAPSGRVGAQDKCVMTPFERTWGITPGQGLHVFETTLGRIGVAICYDCEFPLLVRALCAAGAEIVLVPSCTEFMSGFHRVRTAALARALENSCVTVQSPTIGLAPWSPAVDVNAGIAGIYVPAEHGLSDTGVVAAGQPDTAQWVHASIDLARLRSLRNGGEMRNVADWSLQPGGHAPLAAATIVSLR
jgi:predicted amidohydrolase